MKRAKEAALALDDPQSEPKAPGIAEARLRSLRAEIVAYQQARQLTAESLASTLRSPSWRATRWLRGLKRLLRPTPLTERQLRPLPGIETVDAARGQYLARSRNPSFVLACVPVHGWVRVEFEVECATPTRAHLYWDTGAMFNESEHLDLGLVEGVTRRELLIDLASPAHAFRFDPVRAAVPFAVRRFRITPLAGLAVDWHSLVRRYRRAREGGPFWTSVRNVLWMVLTLQWGAIRGKWRAVLGADASPASDYARWRERHALTDDKRAALRAEFDSMDQAGAAPLISVLLPTYNTPERLLRDAIESVLKQTYPKWELCIADDASPSPHVRRVLEEYAARDPRVRFTVRQTNGHIAAASNTALEMARGEFVALLDHDDLLAEHALSSIARELVRHPGTDMVYSDEDKLTPDGKHLDPFFKPDWSPEYFLACMYTCHLGVYRTALVREVGGFRSEFDQAQDYDLVLRLTQKTQAIRHVPDVLYHWRITPQSTAGGAEAKPQAHYRAQAAIRDHLASLGADAQVTDGPAAGFHRVRHAVRGEPKVTVVIPSACKRLEEGGKQWYWAVQCVESLRNKATYKNLQIVVVGPPQGGDETFEAEMRRLGVLRVAYSLPFNFSAACNVGAAAGDGEHILFLNDDTEVISPDFIEEMLSWSQQPQIGAVGARLIYPDGTLQHVGVTVLGGNPGHPFVQYEPEHPGYFFSTRVHRNWSAVTAACILVRREVFEKVGRFDEYFPMNYNDTDLCLRIREAGYRIVCTPYAQLLHHESVSRKSGATQAELTMFHGRWLEKYPTDPYYNPNLSVTYGDFRIDV